MVHLLTYIEGPPGYQVVDADAIEEGRQIDSHYLRLAAFSHPEYALFHTFEKDRCHGVHTGGEHVLKDRAKDRVMKPRQKELHDGEDEAWHPVVIEKAVHHGATSRYQHA